jgi:uncharacterized protein (DUF1330 family)
VNIEPTAAQLERLANSPDEGPIVMLNLLHFKERADGIDAADGITGSEAYARYGAEATKFLARAGGRILWSGAAQESVIGPHEREWDMVIVVEYPSRAAFLGMVAEPEYQAIHRHRDAALDDSRLIACTSLLG